MEENVKETINEVRSAINKDDNESLILLIVNLIIFVTLWIVVICDFNSIPQRQLIYFAVFNLIMYCFDFINKTIYRKRIKLYEDQISLGEKEIDDLNSLINTLDQENAELREVIDNYQKQKKASKKTKKSND